MNSESTRPLSRLWWAIAIGTLIQVVAFGSLLLGVVATGSDQPEAGGPAFALGFILVPIVCALVAFISNHEDAPKATLKGMGMWLVIALPFGLLNPVAGLSAGFTASGMFTLKSTAMRYKKVRLISVGVVVLYVTLLVAILPQAAIFAGAVTPLLAIRAADLYAERAEQVSES